MNTYTLTVTALCPQDATRRDFYEAVIEAPAQIWCEDIERAARLYEGEQISQEGLTAKLAAEWPSASVRLTGMHGRVLVNTQTRG